MGAGVSGGDTAADCAGLLLPDPEIPKSRFSKLMQDPQSRFDQLENASFT
jgi:hypothetical protein